MRKIPYGRQNLNSDDLLSVQKSLKSPWITQGPAIPEFEEAIASHVGARYGIAVMNGTVALHIAYLAVSLKRGDEILMPANTFAATANAAIYIGAKPVFADIDPVHYNLDPDTLKQHLTRRTKALVAVHFAGHPCAMSELRKFAKAHGLLVIEDAAHALGASYKGKPIGGLRTAVTMFSFHPVKSITTGEGGMLMTHDRSTAEQLRLLRSHGITKNAAGENVMRILGFNYRMTDFQAALGTSQLRRLGQFIRKRHQVVKWYRELLGDSTDITLPTESKDVVSAWHLYVILVQNPSDRSALVRHLVKHGIGANFHYPPVYSHPYYRSHGYARTRLPITDDYARRCITLPLHTLLTENDVRYVARTIQIFFRNR